MPYVELTCSTLQRVNDQELDSWCYSMCLLKGQLYIKTIKHGLQVFDKNLKQIGENELEQLEPIYSVTPLLNDTLVVAAGTGLLHINQQGKK